MTLLDEKKLKEIKSRVKTFLEEGTIKTEELVIKAKAKTSLQRAIRFTNEIKKIIP